MKVSTYYTHIFTKPFTGISIEHVYCSILYTVVALYESNVMLLVADSHGHPKPLACHASAHQQPITHMEFLEDRLGE